MPGGRSPRRKGDRLERELVRLLGGARVPLSGAAGGEFAQDVEHPLLGKVQVKGRRNGFRTLYAALEGADALAVRADRKPWLIVLPAHRLIALLALAQNAPVSVPGRKEA